MPGPDDRDRRERPQEQLSDLADAYGKAAPYVTASTQLVVSVGAMTALGWWLDKKLEHQIPWLLMVGAVVGIVVGFVSFFKVVLGKKT